MNQPIHPRSHPWVLFWGTLLLCGLGAGIFLALVMVTEGVLIHLGAAAVIIAILGLAHYLVWGRALTQQVAREPKTSASPPPWETDREIPPDEFPLTFTEAERAQLQRLVERSLAETRVPVPAGPMPVTGRNGHPEETLLRGLLDKLQGFGA